MAQRKRLSALLVALSSTQITACGGISVGGPSDEGPATERVAYEPRVTLARFTTAAGMRLSVGASPANASDGFFDGVEGYVFSNPAEGRVALVRFENPLTLHEVMVTSPDLQVALIEAGYEQRETLGYIANEPAEGRRALTAFKNPESRRIEVGSSVEARSTLDSSGFVELSVEGYLDLVDPLPMGPPGTRKYGTLPRFGETSYIVDAKGDVYVGDMRVGREADIALGPANEDPSGEIGTVRSPLAPVPETSRRWPLGVVHYYAAPNLGTVNTNNLALAIQHYRDRTGFYFVSVPQDFPGPHIQIMPDFVNTGSWSCTVGYTGGVQDCNFGASTTDATVGCSFGTAVHELGHALGAIHEHQRNDRDSFAPVIMNNIITTGTTCSAMLDNVVNKAPSLLTADGFAYDYGSVMHYGNIAPNATHPCVKTDSNGLTLPIFNVPPGTVIGNWVNGLSAVDRAGFNHQKVQPLDQLLAVGSDWPADATAVAMGDFDGDGRDELLVGRGSSGSVDKRYFVYDDPWNGGALLFSSGQTWGGGGYVTDVAACNIDGDARKEFIVARYTTSNARIFVHDDAQAGYAQLTSFGTGWPSGVYATKVACGNVDSDSRQEIAYGTQATSGNRVFVLDDALASYASLFSTGSSWGSGAYTTGLAFGNTDSDSRQELGVARRATTNEHAFVFDDKNANFAQVGSIGTSWGTATSTSIAFGNLDSDAADEICVTRKSESGNPVSLLVLMDDNAGGYAELGSFIFPLGVPSAHATSCAIADFNRNGTGDVVYATSFGTGIAEAVPGTPFGLNLIGSLTGLPADHYAKDVAFGTDGYDQVLASAYQNSDGTRNVITGFSSAPRPNGSICLKNAQCSSGFCADGVCCNTACGQSNPNDCQACSVAAGRPSNGTCGALTAAAAPTITCRAQGCEVPATCTSASTSCPSTPVLPWGTQCRASTAPCDWAELCDGINPWCPADFELCP